MHLVACCYSAVRWGEGTSRRSIVCGRNSSGKVGAPYEVRHKIRMLHRHRHQRRRPAPHGAGRTMLQRQRHASSAQSSGCSRRAPSTQEKPAASAAGVGSSCSPLFSDLQIQRSALHLPGAQQCKTEYPSTHRDFIARTAASAAPAGSVGARQRLLGRRVAFGSLNIFSTSELFGNYSAIIQLSRVMFASSKTVLQAGYTGGEGVARTLRAAIKAPWYCAGGGSCRRRCDEQAPEPRRGWASARSRHVPAARSRRTPARTAARERAGRRLTLLAGVAEALRMTQGTGLTHRFAGGLFRGHRSQRHAALKSCQARVLGEG